jgi:hypothetical protein
MGAPPLLFYVKRNANRQHSRSQVNNDSVLAGSPGQSNGCRGTWGSGGVHYSTGATRRSGPQALGAHGASHLSLWLHREANSECALGLGTTVGVLGTGVPRLACLRPMAWHLRRPGTAHLHQPPSSPSRGAKPREAVSLRTSGGSNFIDNSQVPREGPSLARRVAPRPPEGAAQQGWLLRSGESYASPSQEAKMTQATTSMARRAPVGAERQFPLW